MISNRCARKSLVTNCNSIISKNYLRFLVDSNDRAMIWDEFLRHFRFCDEEDNGLSDEEQERKGPKNRPKHTRKTGYIKPRKTFWRNSKQLLIYLRHFYINIFLFNKIYIYLSLHSFSIRYFGKEELSCGPM